MALPVGSTAGSTSAPALGQTPTKKLSVSAGLAATGDTIVAAGKAIRQRPGAVLKTICLAPFQAVNWVFWKAMGICADVIWGKGRIPAATVPVEFNGWTKKYIEPVSLETAIENGYKTTTGEVYTVKYVLAKGLCLPDYIQTLGLHDVKFKWLNYRSAECSFTGTFKAAINGRYIDIFQAIKKEFINERQAIAGKWTTQKALTAYNKAAAEKDAEKKAKALAKTKP